MHSAGLVSRDEEQWVNHNNPVCVRFLDIPHSIIKHLEGSVLGAVKCHGFLGQFCCMYVMNNIFWW